MSDRRTISVPGLVYRRAKAYAKSSDLSLSGFVSGLIAEDLVARGVSEYDPGMPKTPRLRAAGPTQGPRSSFSVKGLLYRRARVYAASIRMSLSVYAVQIVEAELERVGFPAEDPGPQERGRGGRPTGPSAGTIAVAMGITERGPLAPLPASSASTDFANHHERVANIDATLGALTVRTRRPKGLLELAEDEARCAEALSAAGLSSGGSFLI